MKFPLLYLLFLGMSTIGFSQKFNADSIFRNDPSAKDFFEQFDTDQMDNIPNWDRIVSYKDLGWKELTMRIYDSKLSSNSNPCLIFFHGGAWEKRAVNQYMQYAWYFSTLGFTTIAVEYRVFNDSSIVTPEDEIEDAKSAIRYVRENSETFKVDTQRIVVTGMSSGGHLAAGAAYINGYEVQDENKNVSSTPNALILQNPAIDLSEAGWVDGHNILGGDWEELSPLHNIDSRCMSIPSIIMSGSSDNLTPVGGMKEWVDKSNGLGCKSYLYIFEGRGHGFGNYSESKSGEGHRDFIYCVYFMQRFLAKIGFCGECSMTSSPGTDNKGTLVYPNPANENIIIKSDRVIEKIIVYTLSGTAQQAFSPNSGFADIKLNQINTGFNYLKIHYRQGSPDIRFFIKQ